MIKPCPDQSFAGGDKQFSTSCRYCVTDNETASTSGLTLYPITTYRNKVQYPIITCHGKHFDSSALLLGTLLVWQHYSTRKCLASHRKRSWPTQQHSTMAFVPHLQDGTLSCFQYLQITVSKLLLLYLQHFLYSHQHLCLQ